jgi:hypothetical protein
MTSESGNGGVCATANSSVGTAAAGQVATVDGSGNVQVQTTVTIPSNGHGDSSYSYLGGGAYGLVDDFMSMPTITISATQNIWGDTYWTATPVTAGTTGTVAAGTSTFLNPGTVLLTTPATTGDGIAMHKSGGTGSLGVLGANAGWQEDFWFQTPATITNWAARLGYATLGQQAADPPTGGAWLEYDTANGSSSTDWTFRTCNAGTCNYDTTHSLVPAASTWYHLRIYSTVAGTIGWQLGTANGALSTVATDTTDVDTTSKCEPYFQVIARTTAAATLTVDRFSYVANTGRL